MNLFVDENSCHFLSYYDAFDNVATQENLPEPLFPSWHNGLEIPFLFLCDLHPYVLTNLIRSLLDEESEVEEDDDDAFFL
ncbi:hypothetical protein CICLE_v10018172mg [Citrus x clementina]|uniref:DOG1 domain-containing protein n=1 Tax=Citrus clementina TaxID=85681 RepID=V4W406_CITCL|nr:hypothetical protein CICLE_v10018172mg [Citrus x clementina]